MITPGLVSITFRQLGPEAVVDLVVRAGLEAIEWGGDVHVPHGDRAAADRVGRLTRDAGLKVACYGSYFRLGVSEEADDGPTLRDVLETAVQLGAPWIRVWAGRQGSADATPADRARVADDARRCADLAAEAGLGLVLEYHGGTLTDTADSAVRLLSDIDHPRLKSLWQPTKGLDAEANLTALRKVLPWLVNLHLFSWGPGGYTDRLPLVALEADWRTYLDLARSDGQPHAALLEFVRDDAPDQFLADAASLRAWLPGRD